MLVPRAFLYSASPPKDTLDEKSRVRQPRRSVSARPEMAKSERVPERRPSSPTRIATEPIRTATEPIRTPTLPISVRAHEHTYSAEQQTTATLSSRTRGSGRRGKTSAHDPNALPPAIAALLAVTTIPRPKPNQFRRPSSYQRQISIEELVNEWKNDDTLKASYSSSPALSVLLEDVDDVEEQCRPESASAPEESYLCMRSTSAESVPSLDADEKSLLSNESPSTPASLRSQKSVTNLKKEKARSLPTAEECALDHPLIQVPLEDDDPDDSFILSTPSTSKATPPKPRSYFKSNLTSSLQALKKAALNSISSFASSSGSASNMTQHSLSSPLPDDSLWSHPFLFPRFAPEVRPAIEGTPTTAQRRYLNPLPLTFEEQEAPYQLALHAPYLAESVAGAPTIQMQTYTRARRKSGGKRAAPDPQSEAGRALLGASGVRQREPRENSDFLRVVVLEMNMRREGKLEYGKAKMWLPPRQVSGSSAHNGKVPRRWMGESAY